MPYDPEFSVWVLKLEKLLHLSTTIRVPKYLKQRGSYLAQTKNNSPVHQQQNGNKLRYIHTMEYYTAKM